MRYFVRPTKRLQSISAFLVCVGQQSLRKTLGQLHVGLNNLSARNEKCNTANFKKRTESFLKPFTQKTRDNEDICQNIGQTWPLLLVPRAEISISVMGKSEGGRV